jgi:predicted PurR-regulated permease PerM
MNTKDKIIFFGIIAIIFASLIYAIRSVITPFVVSAIIAYFLDPSVDKIEKKFHFSRLSASIIIMSLFLFILVVVGLVIFPMIYDQTLNIIQNTPQYISFISDNFYPKIVNFFAKYNIKIENDFFSLLNNNNILNNSNLFIEKIIISTVGSTAFLINFLSLLFIMPILVFYLLKDWNNIVNKIYSILPKKYAQEIKYVFILIDKSLSSYARGQVIICLILAIFYAFGLTIFKLNHGFSIGIITGLLSFIPYVGFGLGVIIGILDSLIQWGLSFANITPIIIIFVTGQFLESNFLTPSLIGKKVELHPLWIIFGIFFFGALFGFLGVFLSVPLTAIFSVLIKYFFNRKWRNINT